MSRRRKLDKKKGIKLYDDNIFDSLRKFELGRFDFINLEYCVSERDRRQKIIFIICSPLLKIKYDDGNLLRSLLNMKNGLPICFNWSKDKKSIFIENGHNVETYYPIDEKWYSRICFESTDWLRHEKEYLDWYKDDLLHIKPTFMIETDSTKYLKNDYADVLFI